MCIWNERDKNYQMSPCMEPGFIDPRLGRCNCEGAFIKEIEKMIQHAKHKLKKVKRQQLIL